MANSSPPWAAYRALMTCRLVVIDKSPGVRPVGIGGVLRQALAKLFMRAAGDQANMACGNLQLCAGLEAGIEGVRHAVVQRILERLRLRRREEEEETTDVEEGYERVVTDLKNLTIETAGREEDPAENMQEALEMEIEVEGVNVVEGEEEGGGTIRALGDLELLTQDAEPSGTTLVDARNGFNELSHFAILWTVRYHWPEGARFFFDF